MLEIRDCIAGATRALVESGCTPPRSPGISGFGGTVSTKIICSSKFPELFGGLIAVPAIIFCIIPEILPNTAMVYVLSSASAAFGPAAFIVVDLSSAPRTTVLRGTIIGVISSYSPTATRIVVVPENPSSTCSQA